jgi:hypothetical protein
MRALYNFLADAPPKDKAWRAGDLGLSGSPMALNQGAHKYFANHPFSISG